MHCHLTLILSWFWFMQWFTPHPYHSTRWSRCISCCRQLFPDSADCSCGCTRLCTACMVFLSQSVHRWCGPTTSLPATPAGLGPLSRIYSTSRNSLITSFAWLQFTDHVRYHSILNQKSVPCQGTDPSNRIFNRLSALLSCKTTRFIVHVMHL